MTLQQIDTNQISGYSSGTGTFETFSATPGNVATFTITATGTVVDGVFSIANTTDSVYMSCPFSFGNLATGTARVTYAILYAALDGLSAPNGARYVKFSRDTAGTGLTVTWGHIDAGALLGVGSGVATASPATSFNNHKYAATLRSTS